MNKKQGWFYLYSKINILCDYLFFRNDIFNEVVLDDQGVPIHELDGSIHDFFNGNKIKISN